jgi:cardiolipin synthase
LTSHPRKARKHLDRVLYNVIRHAQKTCYITTPYFLPTRKIRDAIIKAKDRGCDVRILTTGVLTADVPAFRLGSLNVYGKFLTKGIKIYEYQRRTLHSKTMVIDGICSSIGSYNFDRMSFASNLEIGIVFLDTTISAEMEATFHEELQHAHELTYEEWRQRPWYIRLAGWILYNMMRILGP